MKGVCNLSVTFTLVMDMILRNTEKNILKEKNNIVPPFIPFMNDVTLFSGLKSHIKQFVISDSFFS